MKSFRTTLSPMFLTLKTLLLMPFTLSATFVVAPILMLLTVSFLATPAVSQTNNTPFQHAIIVVQENRTPDNLFGSDLYSNPRRLPNAHLQSWGLDKCTGQHQTLQPLSLDTCVDPDHSHATSSYDKYIYGAWETMYDGGAMDGACNNHVRSPNCPPGPAPPCETAKTCPYSYVDNTPFGGDPYGIVEPYFQIAMNYGYANWMFQTNQGPSFEAHQFLFTGTSAPDAFNDPSQNCGTQTPCWQWFAAELAGNTYGCIASAGTVVLEADPNGNESPGYQPPWYPWTLDAGYPCYEHNTMTDLLENNTQGPISWRFYGYDDGKNPQAQLWNAPNAIHHICESSGYGGKCTGPDWPGSQNYNYKIVLNQTQVLTDLGANPNNVKCGLQPVSWVIPDGTWSDHPGTPGSDAGPSWVAAIVNAVGGFNNDGSPTPGNCGYWGNTVILVTWDDWGGFYDDVLPWNCASAANGGKCSGYSNGTGPQYVYSFRVPLLVVSAWTPPGYVSGSPSQGGEVQPYIHDFGSILNFTEWALGQNQQPLSWPGYPVGSGINPQYEYADFLAPDVPPSCPPTTCQKWSLADFFLPFNTNLMRDFTQITGAKYPTSYFLDPSAYFPNYPSDPDNDASESQ